MKQRCYLTALCAAICLLLFSACGASGVSETVPVIYDALETVKAAHAGEIKSITYTCYTEGGALSGSVTDAGTIEEIYLRLCRITPGEESKIGTSDDGLHLMLDLGDSTLSFYFEGNNLVIGKNQYTAENLGSLKTYIHQLLSAELEETAALEETAGLAEEAAAAETKADNEIYQYWQYYNGYGYSESNGQLRYWIEFRDEFYLHRLFRSGEPAYSEEVYTLYPDWEQPTAQELTIRAVKDGNGHDISDQFESLVFLFSSEDVVFMQVKRNEQTLTGGGDDRLLTGEYTLLPRSE